jgi:hypothetical protein
MLNDFKELELNFLEQFPKGWICIQRYKNNMIMLFGIQSLDNHVDNLLTNDPAFHSLLLMENDNKLVMSVERGGELLVMPAEYTNDEFGCVKVGLTTINGSSEYIKNYLQEYFKRLRKIVNDNFHNLAHRI